MERMGISHGADLKKYSKIELAQKFGKAGSFFYDIVRGKDDRPVNNTRIRKSLAVERTLQKDLSNLEEIEPILLDIIDKFCYRLAKANNYGRTLTLKLKTSDFKTITRSTSKRYYIKDEEEIKNMALQLMEANEDAFDKIRLIGLTASNLEKEQAEKESTQLSFEWD